MAKRKKLVWRTRDGVCCRYGITETSLAFNHEAGCPNEGKPDECGPVDLRRAVRETDHLVNVHQAPGYPVRWTIRIPVPGFNVTTSLGWFGSRGHAESVAKDLRRLLRTVADPEGTPGGKGRP